jgi:Glu-tRNA(Gln) amidotransferase subunit E-like FAD-binding protein
MKVLNTEKTILSLEDVRRVDLHVIESKHTSYGKPYTINHYDVIIAYTDQTSELIACGEDENGRVAANLLMDKIFAILSEKN